MNETIFDLIEDKIPEGKEGYFEIAKRAPQPKDDSYLSQVSDYAKTLLKGSIEGVVGFGQMLGPSRELSSGEFPYNLNERKKDISEFLEENLPVEENYIQSSLRRGLKQAPTALSFPGSTAMTGARALGAGFLGEAAKELGGGELIQTAAELTSYIGPDLTKKLLEKGKNKELIQFAKKMGMTDEEITPLIQGEFKQKWLSKLSPKRGSTQEALKNTKTALDNTYGTIQKSEIAANEISEKANGKLINGLYEYLSEMPSAVKDKISGDLDNLLKNKITGRSLINFWKDINYNMSDNAKELSLLKKPLKEAISSLSPELGKDFEMVNSLYTKYYPIASKLKPNLVSDLISAGEALGILGSLTMGYYPHLASILGEQVAKKLSQQMLINPRLQNLSRKMVKAMNENKFEIVKKLTKSFTNQLKESSPEASKELDKITDEEIENLLKAHHK